MSLALADTVKTPDSYWKNEKFVRRYVMNTVNLIRENQPSNLFNCTCVLAFVQGIQYLHEKVESVIDVGCGHSVRSLDIKAKLGCRMVGVDYSDAMLEQARHINSFLPEERRIELAKADASKLPFADGEFDVAVTYGLFMSLPQPQPAADEMMRVVKYGIVSIEETDDVMDEKQLENFTKVKTQQYPNRIYWHNYARLMTRAGARTTLFSPLPVPENWDLGQPPGYCRIMGAK